MIILKLAKLIIPSIMNVVRRDYRYLSPLMLHVYYLHLSKYLECVNIFQYLTVVLKYFPLSEIASLKRESIYLFLTCPQIDV